MKREFLNYDEAKATGYNLKELPYPSNDICGSCHDEGSNPVHRLFIDGKYINFTCRDCEKTLKAMTDDEFIVWLVTRKLEA